MGCIARADELANSRKTPTRKTLHPFHVRRENVMSHRKKQQNKAAHDARKPKEKDDKRQREGDDNDVNAKKKSKFGDEKAGDEEAPARRNFGGTPRTSPGRPLHEDNQADDRVGPRQVSAGPALSPTDSNRWARKPQQLGRGRHDAEARKRGKEKAAAHELALRKYLTDTGRQVPESATLTGLEDMVKEAKAEARADKAAAHELALRKCLTDTGRQAPESATLADLEDMKKEAKADARADKAAAHELALRKYLTDTGRQVPESATLTGLEDMVKEAKAEARADKIANPANPMSNAQEDWEEQKRLAQADQDCHPREKVIVFQIPTPANMQKIMIETRNHASLSMPNSGKMGTPHRLLGGEQMTNTECRLKPNNRLTIDLTKRTTAHLACELVNMHLPDDLEVKINDSGGQGRINLQPPAADCPPFLLPGDAPPEEAAKLKERHDQVIACHKHKDAENRDKVSHSLHRDRILHHKTAGRPCHQGNIRTGTMIIIHTPQKAAKKKSAFVSQPTGGGSLEFHSDPNHDTQVIYMGKSFNLDNLHGVVAGEAERWSVAVPVGPVACQPAGPGKPALYGKEHAKCYSNYEAAFQKIAKRAEDDINKAAA